MNKAASTTKGINHSFVRGKMSDKTAEIKHTVGVVSKKPQTKLVIFVAPGNNFPD